MKIAVLKQKNKANLFNALSKYKLQILSVVFLSLLTICFITNLSKYLGVVLEGILLYGTKVLPGLLPFFFVTKIFSSFDVLFIFCNCFKKFNKVFFNTPAISCYIYFMSIISGYPMGAKLTDDFYEMGLLTRPQAQRIMSFCSTSGPLFIIGSIGAGFLKSKTLGVMIFLSHLLASFLNGIIYRNYGKNQENINANNTNKIEDKIRQSFNLDDTMLSSIKSVLIVGGYIVIFYALIEVLLDLNLLSPLIDLMQIFGLENLQAKGLICGIIEVTKGVGIISQTNNIKLAFILTSGLVSFSGLSIFIQSFSFLNKIKLNKKIFLLQKITHSILTMAISYLISFFIF